MSGNKNDVINNLQHRAHLLNDAVHDICELQADVCELLKRIENLECTLREAHITPEEKE